MVAIGDLLDASKFLLGDIFARALALLGDDAVCGPVACTLPARDCWNEGAGGNDLVCFEAFDLGDSLGVGGVAGCVKDEKFVGLLLGDDTTVETRSVLSNACIVGFRWPYP